MAEDLTFDIIVRDRGGSQVMRAFGNTVDETGRKIEAVGDKAGSAFDGLDRDLGRHGDSSAIRFAAAFSGRIGPLMARAPISPPLIGAVAAAAPAISSAVSGAVTAGVALASVAAGLKLAFTDPRVSAASDALKKEIGDDLKSAAEPFAPEIIEATQQIRNAWRKDLRPEIEGLFEDSAKFVDPLTEAGIGFTRNVVPGIREANRNATPLIDMLGFQIPRAGETASAVLEDLSATAKESANTISGILTATQASVQVGGDTIRLLAEANKYLGAGGPKILADLTAPKEIPGAKWIDPLTVLAEAAAAAAAKTDTLRASLTLLEDAATSGRSAELSFAEGIDRLTESVEKNGTTMDIGSEKGRANRRVIEDLIAAADQAGDAAEQRALAEGKSAEQAAAAGAKIRETWIADLEAAAREAGLSEDAIAAMVAEAKRADETRIRIYHDTIFRMFGKPFTGPTGIGGSTARGYSQGGLVTGGVPGHDSVPAMLTPGEGVLTKMAMDAIGGQAVLDALNRGATPAVVPHRGGGGFAAGPTSVVLSVASTPGNVLDSAFATWVHKMVTSGVLQLTANGVPVRVMGR